MQPLAAAWGIGALLVALHRSLRAELSALALGLVASALVLGAVALEFARLQSAPPIYQVTTDTNDPPMFERGRDDAAGRLQSAHVRPRAARRGRNPGRRAEGHLARTDDLRSPLDPDAALDRAVETAEDMGLAVVNVDRANGLVEATATTFWFGFTDRCRRAGPWRTRTVRCSTRRSVSRVGVSDVGANARRLLRFLEAFAEG